MRKNISQAFTLYFGVLLLLSSTATANPCSPIDLNLTEPLKSMPIADQDGSGVCYAETAAQQLEFELKKSGQSETVSPVDLGFLLKKKMSSSTDVMIQSGRAEDAMDIALRTGVVPRECIDQLLKKYTHDQAITEEEFVSTLDQEYAKQKLLPIDINTKHLTPACEMNSTVSAINRDGLFGETPVQILAKVLYPCERERKPVSCETCVSPGYQTVRKSAGPEMSQFLDRILDQHEPAGVSLCAEVLKGDLADKSGSVKCSNHSLLAVGRRMNGNKCEYLLRNSWGGIWEPPGMHCACKTPIAYYADCNDLEERYKIASNALFTPGKPAHFEQARAAFHVLDSEYSKRVTLGCWLDSSQLQANAYSVEGFAK
jgi:hypothetical protein